MTRQVQLVFFTYTVLVFISLFLQKKIEFVDFINFGHDLKDFFSAANIYLSGGNPYDIKRFVTPPPSLLPSAMLAPLGFHWATIVFFSLNIGLIFSILLAVSKKMALKKATIVNLMLFTFTSFPTQMLIERGNIDGLVFSFLAICLFCEHIPLVAFSFVSAVSLKIYPVLLLPVLLARYKWRFVFYVVGFSLILSIFFKDALFQYIPNLIGRVGGDELAENISPYNLFHIASRILSKLFPEWQWNWVQQCFYIFSFGYLAANLYFDFLMNKKNILSGNFYMASTAYLPAMLFFPNLVFAYSGIILFLLFVILEKNNHMVKALGAKNIIPLAEVMIMFCATAYAGVTDMTFFHLIPPLGLAIVAVYTLLIKGQISGMIPERIQQNKPLGPIFLLDEATSMMKRRSTD